MPVSITVRAAAARSAKIAPTASAASTVRISPPSTTSPEPVSARASAGPSAASAQTAQATSGQRDAHSPSRKCVALSLDRHSTPPRALSCLTGPESKMTSFGLGADDYVSKPPMSAR